MLCKQCDYTCRKIGVEDKPYVAVPIFWCPRCGAWQGNDTSESAQAPLLVVQCRSLLEQYSKDERVTDLLRLFSITESVTSDAAKPSSVESK